MVKKIKNRNPRADPDHHQKSTTSRGSSLARACQVWSTSVSAFVIYPVYRMTDRVFLGFGNGGVPQPLGQVGRSLSSIPSLPLPFPSPTLPVPSLPPPLPFSSPPFPFLSPPLPVEVGPRFGARRSGGALKLPQRVRAEPGRQTFSGAYRAENPASGELLS